MARQYDILYQVERTKALIAAVSLLVCIQYHEQNNFPIWGGVLALVFTN